MADDQRKSRVTVGKIDPVKSSIAKKMERVAAVSTGAGGFGMRGQPKQAGMLLDNASLSSSDIWGGPTDAYRTSYASGNTNTAGGTYDIPTYFVIMNQQNGGVLYWPANLRERYSWYRYFARCFTRDDVVISMADGSAKKLADIVVGEKVASADGRSVRVVEKTSQMHEGFVYKFSFSKRPSIEVTEDHPFLVVKQQVVKGCASSSELKASWLEASKICVGDYLVCPAHVLDSKESWKDFTYSVKDLVPIVDVTTRCFVGKIHNIMTDGKEYDQRTFFANGYATHNTDAYVGRALELLTDLPMSKITLNMPHVKDKAKREEIKEFYQYMCDRINLFDRLQQILWEYNLIGNCIAFTEWDEEEKMWSRISILPPEDVKCFTYPFSDNARIEYRNQTLFKIIENARDQQKFSPEEGIDQEILQHVPKDVQEMILRDNCIVMDSNPIVEGEVGSFAYQFARRRSPYLDLGASVLERVLVPMLMKENYRYTQLALATRNMTPKNKISAPGLSEPEINNLRAQVDLSYMDPEYTIITNYDWNWEMIGADQRILNLRDEYEMIENQVFAGLGVTRELLTGEGTYSGNRITVDILNTVFLLTREMLQRYVETFLFKPVAEANGWYEVNKRGHKKYYVPKLSFNRLTIRDNQEVFESLFQLYQKGSLPVDIIYELYNLDPESTHEQIKEDLFTVKDPTFNRAVEEINTEVGRQIAERSDVVDKVAQNLGLKMKAATPSEGELGSEFGESSDLGEEYGSPYGSPVTSEMPEESQKLDFSPSEEPESEESKESQP